MTHYTSGFASAYDVLTSESEKYEVYASSPGAYSNPQTATGVNILVTRNNRDISQKNFEVILQGIGLRTMPVQMTEPNPVKELSHCGSSLEGEGYVWRFSVEPKSAFKNKEGNDVGLLIEDLNGFVLSNLTLLRTKGLHKNIEFVKIAHSYKGENDG